MKKLLLALCVTGFLYGCSSGVQRAAETPPGQVVLSQSTQIADVTIGMTSAAKQKAAENLKFNHNELLDHVKRALDSQSLISQEENLPTVHIEVKDIRVRSNFSAVMWGFMAGADSITGDIVIKAADGRELDRFEVSVSYALGGLAGGQDTARMGWLYEKFAEETLNELTAKNLVAKG